MESLIASILGSASNTNISPKNHIFGKLGNSPLIKIIYYIKPKFIR